jgi:hypothetical protein
MVSYLKDTDKYLKKKIQANQKSYIIVLSKKKNKMSIENLGRKHITAAQIAAFDAALDTQISILSAITNNLSDVERQRFSSVNEQNKLLINAGTRFFGNAKVRAKNRQMWIGQNLAWIMPTASLPIPAKDRLNTLLRMLKDFKIVHDFDNYQDALIDKRYTDYKASTNTPGYSEKAEHLRQFFPNTGNIVLQ